MMLTKINLIQAYGIGFLGSAIIQTLVVLWLPSLMTYIGTTVIITQVICYSMGLILLRKSIKMKHNIQNENTGSQKNKKTKSWSFWSEPKQKYLFVAVMGFMLTAFLLGVIENTYFDETNLSENKIFEYFKSIIGAMMISLVILYLILHRKNNWANKRTKQERQREYEKEQERQREYEKKRSRDNSHDDQNNGSIQNHEWCYEILGLLADASRDEVKERYRELTLQMHPDRNRSYLAEERFKKIKQAYDILKEERKTN